MITLIAGVVGLIVGCCLGIAIAKYESRQAFFKRMKEEKKSERNYEALIYFYKDQLRTIQNEIAEAVKGGKK